MTKDKIIEIIVGVLCVALVGYLAWLGMQTVDINRTLSSVDGRTKTTEDSMKEIKNQVADMKDVFTPVGTKGNATAEQVDKITNRVSEISTTLVRVDSKADEIKQRVDRIVTALPGIGVQIAEEEIIRAIQAVVVTTKPVEVSRGNWVSTMHILNPSTAQRMTYTVSVTGPDDKKLKYLVWENVMGHGGNAISFSRLEGWSSVAKKPVTLPAYVEEDASYVWTDSTGKATIEKLRSLGVRPAISVLPSDVNSWEKLTRALKENPKDYAPKNE